jgi:hypothetical protein
MAKRRGQCMCCGLETEIRELPCQNTSVCARCAMGILGGSITRWYVHCGEHECLRLRCACGREVICEGFTNTCACGRGYNWGGQPLAAQEGEGKDESMFGYPGD